jgi:DNA-binding protein H-NS
MPTIEQLHAKMQKLQAQADTLIARKAQAAVDQIRKIMLAHGLTTQDIEAKAKARRDAKAVNGAASNGKAKLAGSPAGKTPPKYRHPKTGATWTGHGRAPAWIATVKNRSKFLIDAAAAVATETVAPAKTRKVRASAANGAVAKKSSPRKIAAKKVVAKKSVSTKAAAASKTAPAKKASRKRAVAASTESAI